MKQKYIYILIPFLVFIMFPDPIFASFFSSKTDSIQIVFDSRQLVLPGESFEIGIISYRHNGKVLKTFGMEGGSVFWWKYVVEVTGGTNRSGKISVNEKLMPSKGKYIGLKVYPKKHPEQAKKLLIPLNYETEIFFRPTVPFDKAPGGVIEGALVSKFDNGVTRVLKKVNNSGESDNFRFYVTGGYWKRGKLFIDPEFLNIENHRVSLITNSLRNTSVSDTFAVTLDYKHNFHLYFQGNSGFFGFSGTDGSSGFSGSDGCNGGFGQDGGSGENGPDIGVWADLYFDSLLNCNLLYVYTENFWTGEEHRYLVNPEGGSFSVTSNGGDGGSGGDGGDGGDGGNGHDGEIWYEYKQVEKVVKKPQTRKVEKKITKKVTGPDGKEKEVEETVWEDEIYYVDVVETETITIRHQQPGERGGDGGNGGGGGFGGPGGDGGDIYFYFTDDSRPYENLFSARNKGGSGGMHGNGGKGGRGGHGGSGEPNGPDGFSGQQGPSAIGWAETGWSGKIYKDSTEEFYIALPAEKLFPEK